VIWFTDTSALVKRYVNEPGSQWLRQSLAQHQIVIAQITPIEMMAALGRRFLQGNISQFTLYQSRRRFMAHRVQQQYQVVDLGATIVEEAMRLAVVRSLRTYDAVQLATALDACAGTDRSRFIFLTADAGLERVAQVEGLMTDNPLRH
jgi:predicted nucleic acid-binding protein